MKYAERIYRFVKNNKKLILNKILKKKRSHILKKLIELGASKVDYVECVDLVNKKIYKNSKLNFKVFIAYYIGDVRLIDNL